VPDLLADQPAGSPGWPARRISWLTSPPELPESSAALPANPAKFRSYQALKLW